MQAQSAPGHDDYFAPKNLKTYHLPHIFNPSLSPKNTIYENICLNQSNGFQNTSFNNDEVLRSSATSGFSTKVKKDPG